MKNTGWVRVYRQIDDSKLWHGEAFAKGQAWIDLVIFANHQDGWFFIRGNRVDIKRGQIGWSELTMAKRWHWSRNKVRAFLKLLENEHQIEQQKSSLTTVITILNYDKYQPERTAEGTTEGQQKDSRRYTNKNVKNDKNEINNTNVLQKVEYGSKDISLLIGYMKEKLGLPTLDESERTNRNYANLLIKKFGDTDKVQLLIDATSTHEFWSTRITSMKQLYYKGVQIISSSRSQKGSVTKV